jgi:glycerophosphoryl diester phosphodiesterase
MKPAALITAALLTAAPAIAAGDTQPTAPAAPAVKFAIPRIPVVAHRGASFDFPENTLAAFRGAAAAGADGCEFDVHAAADGTLIIIHDNTLNRTTDIAAPRDDKGKPAKMPVAEKTPAEIKTLKLKALANRPWKAKDFAAERIPTLAETLAFFAGDAGAPRPVPVVEIKVEHIEPQIIAALRDARLYDRALIVSFSRTVVKTIRRLAPDLPVAWLYGGDKNADRTPAELVDFLSQTARELDTPLLDLSHKLLTKEIVTELHRRGFIVWAWTVDDPARMAELRAWGITSITSNKPALLKEVTSGK